MPLENDTQAQSKCSDKDDLIVITYEHEPSPSYNHKIYVNNHQSESLVEIKTKLNETLIYSICTEDSL